MSYILDAIKKAEQERDKIQLIDIKYHPVRSPGRFFSALPIWLLISALLTMNLILFTVLLSPKAPLVPPTVYFISTLPQYTSVPLLGESLVAQNNKIPIESTKAFSIQAEHSVTNPEKLLSLNKVPIDF
jgi:hypothetical protein